ncbi:MAG: MarC family protein [Reyranella sp.]|uniref:MarC family protein n=1 Tax=Reyranella sp. TaxID=1929291 RepID=UPI001ACEBB69|nr:MarC family protein [Reyranella sp.]MBN9086453.1 MarC family protein [Reyranella sp.]
MGTSFTHTFIYELVTLFVILDPVSTIPIFLTATLGQPRREALKVAAFALAISFAVLLFFISGGQLLLRVLHIPMESFQLAGSIVLLLFGLKLVLGKVTEEAAGIPEGTSVYERAIHPLAIPGIAGPGAMLTVVLLADNDTRTFGEQAITAGQLSICLLVMFGLFAASSFLYRVLGRGGVEVISRVFGLILASIAVNNMIIAIKLSFGLAA